MRSCVRFPDVPVTVKVRSGWDPEDVTAMRFACAAAQAGVKAIMVHARFASQGFGGTADWSVIGAVKEAVQGAIPVIGNGDIETPQDARRMIAENRLRCGNDRARGDGQPLAPGRGSASIWRPAFSRPNRPLRSASRSHGNTRSFRSRSRANPSVVANCAACSATTSGVSAAARAFAAHFRQSQRSTRSSAFWTRVLSWREEHRPATDAGIGELVAR